MMRREDEEINGFSFSLTKRKKGRGKEWHLHFINFAFCGFLHGSMNPLVRLGLRENPFSWEKLLTTTDYHSLASKIRITHLYTKLAIHLFHLLLVEERKKEKKRIYNIIGTWHYGDRAAQSQL